MDPNKILEWEKMGLMEKMAFKASCEASFLFFFKAMTYVVMGMTYNINWHHRLLAMHIENMIMGKMGSDSLIISVPPGSGKTELFSIFAPAWAHIKTRKLRMLTMSYSKNLTDRNSERVKSMMKHRAFQEMWPCGFAKDRMDEWRVMIGEQTKTEFISASMAGQVTGSRAGYIEQGFTGSLNIDDPDKPEDMFSTNKREANHRRLVNTILSRRAKSKDDDVTPIILIQQRVHVMDCTGFILSGGLGKNFKYTHVEVPALIDKAYIDELPECIRKYAVRDICDTEQVNGYWSYWPFKEGIQSLFDRREANEYMFMSQYMQRPIPLGGNMFKSDCWQFYAVNDAAYQETIDSEGNSTRILLCDRPTPLNFSRRFITADTALKAEEIHDYSVFMHWGIYNNDLYLINMKRGKWEAPELRTEFKSFVDAAAQMNDPFKGYLDTILVEDKASGIGLIQELRGQLPIGITPIPRHRDKISRAHSAKPMIEAGRVVLPWNMKWVMDVVSEMSEFKGDMSHKHDDICDNVFDAVEHALLNQSGNAAIENFLSLGRR